VTAGGSSAPAATSHTAKVLPAPSWPRTAMVPPRPLTRFASGIPQPVSETSTITRGRRSLRGRRASQASSAIPKKARPMAPSASEPSHTSCLRVRAATAPRAMATWKNATPSAKRW
jgi:hypothetical protein